MNSSRYEIKDLTKTFREKFSLKTVLKGLNLTISASDITVILGKSGCGKTTFIKCLAGLLSPTSGKIEFFSKDNIFEKPKVGMVFQESRLMPWLSVQDNILIHSEPRNIDNILELLALKNLGYMMPKDLSGGMAHRVSIGRALAYNPNILIMDEPFAALDYFTRLDMQNQVIDVFKTTQIGVIFVTHNIEEAMAIATRIIVMKNDNSIKDFTISEGFNRDLSSPFFIDLKRQILNNLKEMQ